MIHELREYRFRREDWPTYQILFEEKGMSARRNQFGRLLGAWDHEAEDNLIGFIHLWAYESLDTRAAARNFLGKIPAWIDQFIIPARPLIRSQALSVLNPVGSSGALKPSASRLSYLHRYRCAVGYAPVLAEQLNTASNASWTTEFSDPNEVACLTDDADPLGLLSAGNQTSANILSLRSIRLNPINSKWL